MDTFMDEIKNIKMLTRVVAVAVLINFVIIALLVGPDAVGFDPTYGPITGILNFVIAFCTSGVLMGIYVVFDSPQSAITEGQFVAWYLEDELVGSGVIS